MIVVWSIPALGFAGVSEGFGQNAPVNAGNLTVHFIDVGKGDSMLLTVGDKSMLIDGGRPEMGPRVASYLKTQNVTSIDVLVATHPHPDHIGGFLTVLNEFPVKRVVDSGIVIPSRYLGSYLALVDRKRIPYAVAAAGQTIEFAPGVTVEVLAPPAARDPRTVNDDSLVLKVTYGRVRFLFTGDAGMPEQAYLLSSGRDLRSDVLKVPHHGDWYSANGSFFSRVGPEVSVIEVGPNGYGLPSPGTVRMLEGAGSLVYRTDRDGNVVITTDGRSLTVIPQNPASADKRSACEPVRACS